LKLLIADPQADDERGKEADARRTLTGVFAGFGGLDTSGVYAITDSQNVAGIDTKTHGINNIRGQREVPSVRGMMRSNVVPGCRKVDEPEQL